MTKPRIAVIGTGGTIASQGAGPLDTRRAARLGTQVVMAMVPVVAALQLLVLVVVAWAHT